MVGVSGHLSARNTRHGRSTGRQTGAGTQEKAALYLNSVSLHDLSSGSPDVTDQHSRGLQRPWDSAGHPVYILNKPEQLRGLWSPHRKDGTQNVEAGCSGLSSWHAYPRARWDASACLTFKIVADPIAGRSSRWSPACWNASGQQPE